MRGIYLRTFVPILVFLGVLAGVTQCLRAETPPQTMLIPFNSTWSYSYNQGDLGTGWRAPGFDDSAWPQGPAPIGWPVNEAQPGGLPALSAANGTVIPGNPNGTQITTYYRTHFTFSGNPAETLLVISNVVDDGIVVYLNGTEVGRAGMPAGDITATTGASAGIEASTFGFQVLQVSDTDPLIVGDSVLAVELHSNGSGSTDGLYNGSVVARRVFGPIITDPTQPADATVLQGRSHTLTVVADAAPTPTYQWYFGGNPILDATNATYTITAMTTDTAGDYFCRVTSSSGATSVDSRTATINMQPDFALPVAQRAVWQTLTNLVVTFNEPINPATLDPFFFTLDGPGVDPESPWAGAVVSVNAQNLQINVEFYGFARDPNENYKITVSGVEDPYANVMEDVTLDVAGPLVVLPYSAEWKFNQSNTDLGTAWREASYDDSSWPSGPGVLAQETAGPAAPPPTGIQGTNIQSPSEGGPTVWYARAKFFLPVQNVSDVLGVEITLLNDDSAVIWLNGVQVLERAAGQAPGYTVLANRTQGDANYEGPFSMTNFVAGENTIAVEVHEINATSSDTVWGGQINAVLKRVVSGAPTIAVQPQSITVNEGLTATFNVVASGTPPLAYQWRKGGVDIDGATASTLVIPSVCKPAEGTFTCRISNGEGSVISDPATLTVNLTDTAAPQLQRALAELTWSRST